MDNVEAYYDREYNILVDSEEEDQIYEVVAGKPTYRTEHQVHTLRSKISLDRPIQLLDYGCAKSSTIRALVTHLPNIIPHLFDVSARYIPFWERFATPDNWAVNVPKPDWYERFDVITSFFSLEHIPTPNRTVQDITRLLAPGGYFYAIVPNVFTNVADLIVVDHCNHFTQSSLTQLITDAGLRLLEVDASAHQGALVVVATKPERNTCANAGDTAKRITEKRSELIEIADFWNAAAERVRDYETTLRAPVAIYGAGFYGAFIAANLGRPARVSCYIDQNPFLHGQTFNGKPVVPPAQVPVDVRTIMVGLNPVHAHKIIADVPVLQERNFDYFFL